MSTTRGGCVRAVAAIALLAAGVGSVHVTALPAEVELAEGQNIQAQIDAAASGTIFRVGTGTHRLTSPLHPRSDSTFIGEAGAVISGSRLLTGFRRSGGRWVLNGQIQEAYASGTCGREHPRCARPEDLYVDDVPLRHVASLADLAPGTWYFDYGGDRIYVFDDPSNRRIETAVVAYAFGGDADNVTLAGLVIEKFANRAQTGAVQGDRSTRWTIRDSDVRLNHGVGIRAGASMVILRNHIHHNGQLGVGGSGDNILVEGNEIAHNNYAGYDAGWEAGGAKFTETFGLIARNNSVHHNAGPGLWTDYDNRSVLVEGNVVEDNASMGIFHEISYSAVIRNNMVRRNGFAFSAWVWGSGILVSSSPDVEIHGNVVEGNAGGIAAAQQRRGAGAYGPYDVRNLWVHDNTIVWDQGYTGLVQDIGDPSVFDGRNNRFERNTYVFGANPTPFEWNGPRTARQWRTFGHDTAGAFRER
jgi:parallel beta-helix repeat protein